jgi:3-hydroxyisobutyrate dehydrogenase
MEVGFVGLGDIGEPIARRIIDSGFSTALWARRQESLYPFRNGSGKFTEAADLVELGRFSQIVGVCVFDDEGVREVVLGERGILTGMRAGGVILIHSTVNIDTVVQIADEAAAKQVHVLDAPISGPREVAEKGDMSVMVGGDEAAFSLALPVLRAFSKLAVHLGPIGSGLRMKALNQVLMYANLDAASNAMLEADELGINLEIAGKVLQASTGASTALDVLINRIFPEPTFVRHAETIIAKDTGIYREIRKQVADKNSFLEQLATEAPAAVVRALSASRPGLPDSR